MVLLSGAFMCKERRECRILPRKYYSGIDQADRPPNYLTKEKLSATVKGVIEIMPKKETRYT